MREAISGDNFFETDPITDKGYPDAEIHLTEWSSTTSSRDQTHDSLTGATYIINLFEKTLQRWERCIDAKHLIYKH